MQQSGSKEVAAPQEKEARESVLAQISKKKRVSSWIPGWISGQISGWKHRLPAARPGDPPTLVAYGEPIFTWPELPGGITEVLRSVYDTRQDRGGCERKYTPLTLRLVGGFWYYPLSPHPRSLTSHHAVQILLA